MIEMKFKYFLNGIEIKQDMIDWDRTDSMTIIGDEVHAHYDPAEMKKGLSTRHKIQEKGRYHPYGEKDIVKDISDFLASNLKEQLEKVDPIDFSRFDDSPFGELTRAAKVEQAKKDNTPVGVKHNGLKAPLDIVQTRQFPKALQILALATAFGNKKYEATDKDFLNFKRVPGGSQTYFDAAARHNTERIEVDPDTGLQHIVHAVWNMLAGLELHIEENDIDVKEFTTKYLKDLQNRKF